MEPYTAHSMLYKKKKKQPPKKHTLKPHSTSPFATKYSNLQWQASRAVERKHCLNTDVLI